jgi:hypothetical protein
MRAVCFKACRRLSSFALFHRFFRFFNRWRFSCSRFKWSYSRKCIVGQRRFTFLKQKLHFQLWKNIFIYRSRCSLILSVFSARRNSRALSSAFRSFRISSNCFMRPPGKSPKSSISFLVSRHALNHDFFFISDVFCTWRRAVRNMRVMLFARSRAFAMRPMLLQWYMLAVRTRPSPVPSRAMHFSELLRAQSMSRQILLQPSALLAVRKQSQEESALNHPYWSLPMQPPQSILASSPQQRANSPQQRNVLQPRVISAALPIRFLAQQPSQKPMRIAAPVRPPWVPTSVAFNAAVELKQQQHMGQR